MPSIIFGHHHLRKLHSRGWNWPRTMGSYSFRHYRTRRFPHFWSRTTIQCKFSAH